MNRSHFLHPFFENDSKWIMIEVDLIALLNDLKICGITEYFPNAKFG